MRKILTAAAAALALGGVTLGAAAPAEAHYRGGYYGYGGYYGGYHGRYHHGDGGTAIAAGILGLAAGAAIASSGPRYYYDEPTYYAPPPPSGYYYYEGPYCRSDWRWDGWARRYVRVRYCD